MANNIESSTEQRRWCGIMSIFSFFLPEREKMQYVNKVYVFTAYLHIKRWIAYRAHFQRSKNKFLWKREFIEKTARLLWQFLYE